MIPVIEFIGEGATKLAERMSWVKITEMDLLAIECCDNLFLRKVIQTLNLRIQTRLPENALGQTAMDAG
jgi:hypothetical protein